jgi:flavin reductase (DIM6/NTAB) family NADH-FMN oxidoreductase RutF
VNRVNAAAFREALAHFATGVTVVTARVAEPGGELLVGFTATSFASVSLAPPLVLVCVSHTASAHGAFVRAETFGVSVLGEGQLWLAEQFARKNVNRFERVPLVRGPAAATPLIEGALVHLECRPHSRSEAGDHTVVFGEVLSAEAYLGRPLLYYDRHFGGLEAEPDAPTSADPIGPAQGGDG